MKFKTKKLLLCLSIALMQTAVGSLPAQTATQSSSTMNYAKALGWVAQPDNAYNLSGGYYKTVKIPYVANPKAKSQAHNVNIAANHVTYSTKGTSTLSGDVEITQPSKEVKANKATLYRNQDTGKIDHIKLSGGVRLMTPSELVVGKTGTLNVQKDTAKLYDTAYRDIPSDQKASDLTQKTKNGTTKHYGLVYWGHAKQINKLKSGDYQLKDATYTTCPPTKQCIWHLHASTVNLNPKKGVGDAWNSTLIVKGVPVFYYPYISFPLNKKRKSGFLSPYYSSSDRYGAEVTMPYYWNIAPNYDALLSLGYMTQRGLVFTPLFRYLTATSSGRLKVTWLPHDREFASFKNSAQTAAKYASQPDGLEHLQGASASRYEINFSDTSQFDRNWSAKLQYNRVSDPYFIYDLQNGLVNNSDNQLIQKGEVQYQGQHWNFLGLLQNYQTLHLVNQALVDNQYARLPELNLGAEYPDFDGDFSFGFSSSATRFYKSKAPDQTGPEPVVGDRFTLTPSLEYAFIRPYAFFTPQLQLHMTDYRLQREGSIPADSGLVLPSVDVRAGLNFDKQIKLFGQSYQETLTPHLYYLYVPYHNQNELPLFDTDTQPFNYNYMFLDNRFTGIDRIGDANQVTYAVTTKLINQTTGRVKGSFSIGQILYFKNRQVLLCSGHDCGDVSKADKRTFSPIAGQATYNFNVQWALNASATWNPYRSSLTYQSTSVTYRRASNKYDVFNLGYDYVRSGSGISGEPEGDEGSLMRQLNLSSAWALSRHWDVLGQWSYSWEGNGQKSHADAYLAGLQYNASCWGIRLVAARTFTGLSDNNNPQLENTYYLQFDLHGLGSVGNDDPSSLLSTNISGYQSPFDPSLSG